MTVPTRYRSLISDSARWEGFEFRADDIVISTAPKCGTTWMQMICALLIFQTTTFDSSLDLISPWLDMLTRERDDVIADLDAQTHRRFIKTHTPFDGLPYDERVTYVIVGRDPRAGARSWGHHMANMDFAHLRGARAAAVGLDDLAELLPDGPPEHPDSEIERFWLWVDNATLPAEAAAGGLVSMMNHLTTFWSVRDCPNVVLFHYDDLKSDLEGEMRRLAAHLGITVAEDLWPELVDAATFEQMRAGADRIAPDTTHAIWQSNREFFHRGVSGQWRALLDDECLRRYYERVAELAEPDLIRWVHREPQPAL
ncbi:MAG: aryl sulfotransferase [Actinomycetota bacterium]|nr:aryl sulfotransferase [Actinomycetota bacterium]